jgi:hypothetical protein
LIRDLEERHLPVCAGTWHAPRACLAPHHSDTGLSSSRYRFRSPSIALNDLYHRQDSPNDLLMREPVTLIGSPGESVCPETQRRCSSNLRRHIEKSDMPTPGQAATDHCQFQDARKDWRSRPQRARNQCSNDSCEMDQKSDRIVIHDGNQKLYYRR